MNLVDLNSKEKKENVLNTRLTGTEYELILFKIVCALLFSAIFTVIFWPCKVS
jgi:hypothetical protein